MKLFLAKKTKQKFHDIFILPCVEAGVGIEAEAEVEEGGVFLWAIAVVCSK